MGVNNPTKNKKVWQKWPFIGAVAALISISIVYQNCSKKVGSRSSAENSSHALSDVRLLGYMQEAQDIINDLFPLVDTDDRAAEIVTALQETLDNLERIIYDQRRSNHDPVLLAEVDHLIKALSDAGDYTLSMRLDELDAKIADLEQQFQAFLQFFFGETGGAYKTAQEMIAEFEARNNTDGLNFSSFLMTQLSDLKQANVDLLEQLTANEDAMNSLFDKHASMAELQGRICQLDDPSTPEDEEDPVSEFCNGEDAMTLALSAAGITNITRTVGTGTCSCIPIGELDCNVMFPDEIAEQNDSSIATGALASARAQCQILVGTLHNHDQQLRAIAVIDEEQTAMIAQLNDDIYGEDGLAEQVGALIDITEALVNDVLILKLKSQRAEASASIMERADQILAWSTRRMGDVNHRFCYQRTNQALNHFDYEVARQNWEFCHERKNIIRKAREKAQIAKAAVNGVQSANMDTDVCQDSNGDPVATIDYNGTTYTIMNIPRDQPEILGEPEFFDEIKQYCTAGAAYVMSSMLTANALLEDIAPEFRTQAYMMRKAEVAQRLSCGGNLCHEISRDSIEDILPTSAKNKDKPYGRIERLFKNRYIETVYRVGANQEYPYDASQINIPSIMHQAWTFNEINNPGSDSYLAAVKTHEITNGGWRVTGRNVNNTSNGNPLVDRSGKALFRFPENPTRSCPIENQHVVLQNGTGDYYAYLVRYNHVHEIVRPRTSGGQHVRIARGAGASAAFNQIGQGEFNGWLPTRYGELNLTTGSRNTIEGRWYVRATQPYTKTFTGQQGNCIKFTTLVAPRLQDQGQNLDGVVRWPASNPIMPYLGGSRARWYINGPVTANTTTWLNKVNAGPVSSVNHNPLGRSYWVNSATNGAKYGVSANETINNSNPFYGSNGSAGNKFIRFLETNTAVR